MIGPIRVSITTPPLAFVLHVARCHSVKGVAVFEPSAGKNGPADEVGQPRDLTQISGRCEVVVLAIQLTRLIGAEP